MMLRKSRQVHTLYGNVWVPAGNVVVRIAKTDYEIPLTAQAAQALGVAFAIEE